MKKVMFLFVLALGVMFNSCSKDDDSDNGSLIGKWELTSASVDGKEQEDIRFGCSKKSYVRFTDKEMTWFMIVGENCDAENFVAEYIIKADMITFEGEAKYLKYSVSGNKLKLTFPNFDGGGHQVFNYKKVN